jgi:hypothetical protein
MPGGGVTLCQHHDEVVRNLARHDHLDDEDSIRVARLIAKQCPQCEPQETA